jgi:hypothetical protein
MNEYRNKFYNINLNDTETKQGVGKVNMSMCSWNRLHCQYHEVRKKINQDVSYCHAFK